MSNEITETERLERELLSILNKHNLLNFERPKWYKEVLDLILETSAESKQVGRWLSVEEKVLPNLESGRNDYSIPVLIDGDNFVNPFVAHYNYTYKDWFSNGHRVNGVKRWMLLPIYSAPSLEGSKQLSEEEKIEPVKYGDYVQMDDRFESVHIWSKELEARNNGRFTPLKITKEQYEIELEKQNKGYSLPNSEKA